MENMREHAEVIKEYLEQKGIMPFCDDRKLPEMKAGKDTDNIMFCNRTERYGEMEVNYEFWSSTKNISR